VCYDNWIEPFKNEFKEFLLDKHPEKIMVNIAGFEQLFGASSNELSSSW